VLATTSPSGRWVIPRTEAGAEPVAADRRYAAHFEREGVTAILAMSAVRSQKASRAEALQVYVVCVCPHADVGERLLDVFQYARAKKRGPQGSPCRTPVWEERGVESAGKSWTPRIHGPDTSSCCWGVRQLQKLGSAWTTKPQARGKAR
jgi:hypothetical protein